MIKANVMGLLISLISFTGCTQKFLNKESNKENETKVLPAKVVPQRVPQGSSFKVYFNWESDGPLSKPYKIFVHFLDDNDKIVFQGDHEPPLMHTNLPQWKGKISYEMKFKVPENLADGSYRIIVGLYDKEGRLKLKAGKGVIEETDLRYRVGILNVDSKAKPVPPDTAGRKTLDLSNYELVFNEDFENHLDVSPWGPGTRWIAHTPWHGDFGDAIFMDPGVYPEFPFKVENGILIIEARKDKKFAEKDPWKREWASGLLCSNDPKGNGFSLQYGYFEMRAKLPGGQGVWPAFWLVSSYDRTDKNAGKDGAIEIDIIEYYGVPDAYSSVIHIWEPKPHRGVGTRVTTRKNEITEDFHNYGCMVTPEWIIMYFDGVEVWRVKTPPEHNKPLMILLNFALGSGWPIDKVPNSSFMYVDWVRAYAPKKKK
ncbi:MAG TPA: family 16 glycosylhydrolase [bacterium]|nr:family 16 glycosylhydrolase [bacterium]HOM27607.1 family 16 glycosylhydrolase [bacterium]